MGLIKIIAKGLLLGSAKYLIHSDGNGADAIYSHLDNNIGKGKGDTKNKRHKGSKGPSFCSGGFGPSFENSDK